MARSCRGNVGWSGKRGMIVPAGALAALVIALGAAPVHAQEPGYRGIDIFDATCWACHTDGQDGAPRVGDREAWKPRIAKGLDALTRNALSGVGAMPAHGGSTSLSRLLIERAIVYMANRSGGDWVEPPDPGRAPARSGAQVVRDHCTLCHATGFDGAPVLGDRLAWLPRTRLGLDPLVRAAIRGHGGMPPRGGMASLTDDELRDAVIYMISYPNVPGPGQRKEGSRR